MAHICQIACLVKSLRLGLEAHGHDPGLGPKLLSLGPGLSLESSESWSWPRGVVVNTLASINEVALQQAQLLLGWVTVC